MSLSINHVEVEIENTPILHDVSLTVENGELLSLLGPSGCGKSTLLKAAAGLIDIKDGQIYAGETRLDLLPPDKRGIVVVFQDLRLFSNMSVIDNVAFPLKMQGMKKLERHERAKYYLEKVQLSGMEHRRISQLSGGQQQRVALARGLAADPNVLLLDEPFSSLDENLREDMRQLLVQLHREMKNAIVLVTHDRREALQLSDRIAVMKEGRILQCDTPRQIYEHPASLQIAEYLGLGNTVSGTVAKGVFCGDKGAQSITFETDYPDGAYEALLRKEKIRLSHGGIEARLERVAYLGEAYQVTVSLGEQKLVFTAEPDPASESLQGKKYVHIEIDYSRSQLFILRGVAHGG